MYAGKKHEDIHQIQSSTYCLDKTYSDNEHIVFSCNAKENVFGCLLDKNVKELTDNGYFVCIVFDK